MTLTLTPEQIARLRQLESQASKAPWTFASEGGDNYVRDADNRSLSCDMQYYPWTFDPEDAEFLAASRNALPELLQAAETLATLRALRPELERVFANINAESPYRMCRKVLALLADQQEGQ
jgi:hypothetical protein